MLLWNDWKTRKTTTEVLGNQGNKKISSRETKYINKEKQQQKPWVTKGIKKSVDRETKYINNYWKRMM